ncbi:protease modulator HflC [Tianweitania sediminis]|uniref:Protein HflC n=1 Tax=Tianweitania sediminis TaxID=1502156 RepID=A0A8J7RL20_9HYPH|nr:protease modulator HflC [Tianweitania sediminis]MBP0439161.1 protease modulator HflC [Tianweitania sediminis]
MANRLPAILIILAVLALLVYSSVFVVNERQQAIVLRFGEIVDVKTEPGIYFKAPFGFLNADNVQLVDDRVLRFDLDNIRVQVSGGRFYEVDAYLAYRIADPRVFRSTVSGSVQLAEQRLRTRLDAALRRVYGLRGFEAALSEERSEMMREVANQVRPDAESLGLEVTDVRIRRTDLTQEVSQQTYDRMSAERLAEAERLRARGREAAQRIRARADREVVEITAEAQRESEILRGEGEAERSAIFADAFSRDPQFFEFYRSMAAYDAALDGQGTTMLLSPDTEFFRFFQSPTGNNASAAAGARPATAGATPANPTPAAATPQEDLSGTTEDAPVPGLVPEAPATAPTPAQ